MINLKIDGIPVSVEEGATVLDAAKKAGINIPTLCYHTDLKPLASCGLCIVKQMPRGKIMRSCAAPAAEGMDIVANDPELFEVRKGIIEMMLSTHPDDCLTCIRNQNCELQTLAAQFGIREQPFEKNINQRPLDDSTGAIVLEPAKCIKCGRCVEVCDELQGVNAIGYVGRGAAVVMAPALLMKLDDSPCIKCGQCAAHCPTGAIHERDDTDRLRAAINDPDKIVCGQIAPSIRVGIGEEFGMKEGSVTTGKIYAAMRRLGVDKVFDTNFGADLTIMEEGSEFVHRLTHNGVLPQFTSCCPAWTEFMEEYYPDLIPNMSSAKSPMQMQGAITKTYYAEKTGIDPSKIYSFAIMPCTAKKREIDKNEHMHSSGFQDNDLSITTREFARMMKTAGIDFANLKDEEADSPIGEYTGAGTIFGATGGVMEAALRTAHFLVTGKELKDVNFDVTRGIDKGVKEGVIDIAGTKIKICIVHGMANVKEVANKVREAKQNGEKAPYDFIEVMACQGGCVEGGGQPYASNNENRKERAAGLYKDDENKEIRCSHQNPSIQQLYKEFLGKPLSAKSEKLLHTAYTQRPVYKD